ncbi:hypothetical protein NQ318_001512 [Aromia moschata]|uniref:Uncharacterized protein n=1 Tax=Aromia moschata TaxID=1265417 RepID=A0AAV8Y6V1_9CUCU|nr:hypothetical protein NQ318_001512 [Aromia moschata]
MFQPPPTCHGNLVSTLTFVESLCNVKRSKCTGMDVYPAHKILNGLNGLKRDVKRPKTIRTPDGPQRQKRTKIFRNIITHRMKKQIRNERLKIFNVTSFAIRVRQTLSTIDKLARTASWCCSRYLRTRHIFQPVVVPPQSTGYRFGVEFDITKTIVHEIVSVSLGMRKVCAKLVPKVLTDDQKARRNIILPEEYATHVTLRASRTLMPSQENIPNFLPLRGIDRRPSVTQRRRVFHLRQNGIRRGLAEGCNIVNSGYGDCPVTKTGCRIIFLQKFLVNHLLTEKHIKKIYSGQPKILTATGIINADIRH